MQLYGTKVNYVQLIAADRLTVNGRTTVACSEVGNPSEEKKASLVSFAFSGTCILRWW